jgi:hypothetical protein
MQPFFAVWGGGTGNKEPDADQIRSADGMSDSSAKRAVYVMKPFNENAQTVNKGSS